MFEVQGKYSCARVYADQLEEPAMKQINNLCDQPFTEGSQIRLMPDAHCGAGCVIGSTMTITDKIVPNLVGVDISCGVEAVRLDAEEIDFAALDNIIRQKIPYGTGIREEAHELAETVPLAELSYKTDIDPGKWARAIGSLGSGNHFIEIDRDGMGNFWLVVHSGSRNPGNETANHHQKIAFTAHPEAEQLAWLEGEAFQNYIHDMEIMQIFANANRKAMIMEIMTGMGWNAVDSFTTTHNYLDTEHMILRKGAVSARKGERFILPMNMRDGSIICIGKGNPEWNHSAPHGAGRLMSRTQARNSLSLDEMKEQMKGIWSSSLCKGTLDEAPDAYKPMASILNAINETAEIAGIMKPVYNFKAAASSKRRKKPNK